MSFSKARIQRFNERENDVPPPGAYNPKFDVKNKGFTIEKSGRFHDNRSVASAECNASHTTSTKSTSNGVTCFRTPQLPRKKVTPKPGSKVKPRSLIPGGEQKLKYKSVYQLADLKVECANKSTTIQEHERHIEEMKEELRKLEQQLEESHKKQSQVDEQHKKDIETMAKLQQEILNGHEEKYQIEVENLRFQLFEVSDQKERDIQTRKTTENGLRSRIADFVSRIAALELELAKERRISEEKIQSLQAQIEELKLNIEELGETHICEISSLKQEKLELDSRVQNLADEVAEREKKLGEIVAESDAKVNAMIREAKAAVEEEMQLTTERYKTCLARVEMERTSLENKLTQKNAEMATLLTTVEGLRASAETQESFGQSLQMELDRAETELAEKKEELKALKHQIRSEAAEMVARKKRFEVIMTDNQESVAALTKRLTQSNAEVERLQHELKRGEDCINEHRDLVNIMRNNSEMVYVQVHTLMEQLDTKKGLVNQLEAESLSEVESIKSMFEAKIEDLKEIATQRVTQLQADCEAKDAQNTEMKNQLQDMVNRVDEAQSMLVKLEEKYDSQEIEISRVELHNSKLDEQLKKSKTALKEANKLLEDQSVKHQIALNEAHSKIEELSEKIKCFEEKGGGLQDKPSFDEEIIRREATEVEVNRSVEYYDLTNYYREVSEKYAELVDRQNHKQSQLKEKINQLEQESQAKARTIEQQQRTIEKLKAVEKRVHTKGKENALEVPKSVHTTPVSSPHKILTPLRSRNE